MTNNEIHHEVLEEVHCKGGAKWKYKVFRNAPGSFRFSAGGAEWARWRGYNGVERTLLRTQAFAGSRLWLFGTFYCIFQFFDFLHNFGVSWLFFVCTGTFIQTYKLKPLMELCVGLVSWLKCLFHIKLWISLKNNVEN